MAIHKVTEHGNTGLKGDHWAMSDIQIQVADDPEKTQVVGRYSLWLNREAKEEGRLPLRRGRKIMVLVDGTNPRLSEIEATMEEALTRETVPAVKAVAAVDAQKAVKAKGAIIVNDVEMEPAVLAQAAVKAVKAVVGVPAVVGGDLEGGTII